MAADERGPAGAARRSLRRLVGLREGQLLPLWGRFLRARTRRQRLALVAAETLHDLDSHLTLVSRKVADELRVWSEPVQFMVEPGRDGLIEFVLRSYETEQATGEEMEAAVLALEMIRDNEHGESWAAGVAMSALASIAERHGTEPDVSEYPVLLSEGKLRGYWLIAPGVYQPPCGFAAGDDDFACRLPRGHQGPHYMAREHE